MNREGIMLSEISQTQRDKYCMIPLVCNEVPGGVKFMERKWWLPGAGGRKDGELWLNEYRVPFGEGEKAPEMGLGDGFYTLM